MRCHRRNSHNNKNKEKLQFAILPLLLLLQFYERYFVIADRNDSRQHDKQIQTSARNRKTLSKFEQGIRNH